MGIGTGAGMGSRFPAGRRPDTAGRRPARHRRLQVGYAVQIAGSLVLIAAAGNNVPLLLLGVLLFGVGIGNVTSMPPLIARVGFVKDDVPRVVALVVAIGQATYAFAPAAFGLIREFAAQDGGAAPYLFGVRGTRLCLGDGCAAGRPARQSTNSSRGISADTAAP